MIEIGKPITKLTAVNRPTRVKNYSDENFYGLSNLHYICTDSKITLTNNLWTAKGLVNGANGIIKDILYKPNDNLPFAILIEFNEYTGPRFFQENDPKRNWIPINPLNIFSKALNMSRTQFPIRLAYALTIHKAQGQTLKRIIVELGKKEATLGLTFVALSRVKNVNDFLIHPFPLDRLTRIKNSSLLEGRVKEENRLNNIVKNTLSEYHSLFN